MISLSFAIAGDEWVKHGGNDRPVDSFKAERNSLLPVGQRGRGRPASCCRESGLLTRRWMSTRWMSRWTTRWTTRTRWTRTRQSRFSFAVGKVEEGRRVVESGLQSLVSPLDRPLCPPSETRSPLLPSSGALGATSYPGHLT